MLTTPIEIAVDNARDAVEAAAFADRLEIARALERDGFTPPAALVEEIRSAVGPELELVALIRPHAESVLHPSDLARIAESVRDCLAAGATSVAIGFLDAAGRIDRGVCAALVDAAGGARVTFHRAFDLARDRREAIEDIAAMGIARVLTAGVASFATASRPEGERIADIAKTKAMAGGRFSTIACGGVRSHNARQFAAVGDDVHSACRLKGPDHRPRFDAAEAAALLRVLRAG
jgi:copper homeostasis protein